MTGDMVLFGQRYRRLLRLASVWVALTAGRWRPGFLWALGRWLSPFQLHAAKIRRAIALALPDMATDRVWRDWLDSHLRFVLDFLAYRAMDAAWLKRQVAIAQPALLDALRASGGLVLTYHTHHQNTLSSALGLAGITISPLASAPEDSPLFPLIGRWAQRVNADSAIHFNGGAYVFTDNLRVLVKAVRKLLNNRDVVLSLCDFHQPRPEASASGRLFDRSITPPTGAIDIALRHGAPIYAAICAPSERRVVAATDAPGRCWRGSCGGRGVFFVSGAEHPRQPGLLAGLGMVRGSPHIDEYATP